MDNNTSDERANLLPCPFCAKSVQVVVTPSDLMAVDDYDEYVSPHSPSFAVLCDAHKPDGPDGCGASGGFMPTVDEAIAVWNTRAALSTPPAVSEASDTSAQAVRESVARAIWNLRREDEDRCDMELEDMGEDHPVWDQADAAIAAMPPAAPAVGAPVTSSVTIDFRQATELLDMFGGEPTEITLMTGNGHSGEGLYAVYNADPEGAVYLGETDEEAEPDTPTASVREQESEKAAREAVEEFKRRWMRVPPFADRVNKKTRELISIAISPIVNLPAVLDAQRLGREKEQDHG